MEIDEIMRLIFQGLTNVPQKAPERDKAFRAFGALHSRMNFTSPDYIMEIKPDGFIKVRLK